MSSLLNVMTRKHKNVPVYITTYKYIELDYIVQGEAKEATAHGQLNGTQVTERKTHEQRLSQTTGQTKNMHET